MLPNAQPKPRPHLLKNRYKHTQTLEQPISRECIDCTEVIPETETAYYWETSEEEQFWVNAPKTEGPMCDACWTKRDNREPPEPDGEAFRGGEAAAFQAEQLEQARRLK